MNNANGYISVNRHRAYEACQLICQITEHGLRQQAEQIMKNQAISKRRGFFGFLFPQVAKNITKEQAYEMASLMNDTMVSKVAMIAKLGFAISASDGENVLLDYETVYWLYRHGKLGMSPSFEAETLSMNEDNNETE